MPRCLLALGSNQRDTRSMLEQAISALDQFDATEVVATSQIISTKPVGGPAGQAEFANAASVIETSLKPHDLLSALQAIEHRLGRRRSQRWEARPIDLDILLYEELEFSSEALQIPHPRMSFRPFVMEPAVEVAGDWMHPHLQETLRNLRQCLMDPKGGILIYGGNSTDRRFHAEALADRFEPLAIERVDADSLWLTVGDGDATVCRLALELVDGETGTRVGFPTLSFAANSREEVLFDTTAAVEAVWGDLGFEAEDR